MSRVLSPKGTALWLIQNTSLSDKQVSEFCNLSILDLMALRDNFNNSLRPTNPIDNEQLTWEEIQRCEADQNLTLKKPHTEKDVRKKIPRHLQRYLPGCIKWLISNHSDLSDANIAFLLGTNKKKVSLVRESQHSITSIHNPIVLGLCRNETLQNLLKTITKKEPIRKRYIEKIVNEDSISKTEENTDFDDTDIDLFSDFEEEFDTKEEEE